MKRTKTYPYHYPVVETILNREVKRAGQEYKLSQNAIAERCALAPSTFSEVHLKGLRALDADFVELFVDAVLRDGIPNRARRKADLTAELMEATKVAEANHDTTLKRLKAGQGLSTTTIDYYPFAGNSKCFFESVFRRFFHLAGIPWTLPEPRRGLRREDYRKTDIALGLFASPDRMLTLDLKFWPFPIRMGLGAVCLARHQQYRDSLARVLSGIDEKTAHPAIRPIVVENDIGSIHCQKRLGYNKAADELLEVRVLDAVDLTSRLRTESNSVAPPIPVICTDEYTALRVLHDLGEDGLSIFPMNSRRAGQAPDEHTRRELPQYYCSVAISGSEEEHGFQTFIQDALVHFLSTEIETTSDSLCKLAIELAFFASKIPREQMPDARPSQESLDEAQRWAHAWEWVFYTLNLDVDSRESYASSNHLSWKPILRRARQLVQQHLSRQSYLRPLVDLLWEKAQDKDRLLNLLDITVSPEIRNLAKPYVVSALRRELTGSHALNIVVDPYDPCTAERAALAMRQFMRRLQNEYDDRGYDDAVKRLRKDLDEMTLGGKTCYGGRTGRVILARISTSEGSSSFVGGACLRHDAASRMCELRYLWVEPHYRGRNVGKKIVRRALTVAEQQFSARGVYVEILEKLLQTAATLFTEIGFMRSEQRPSDHGRTVLEIEIEVGSRLTTA